MSLRNVLLAFCGLIVAGIIIIAGVITKFSNDLPQMIQLSDYKPLLVSEVYDRNGKKIGEFFRQKRTLIPYNEIPQNVINAFVAAEDDTFFKHEGVNYIAIIRATLANIRSGKKSQGGSTITQQVARSILLMTNEKTYTRKIKEILLAHKMEKSMSKQDILYLYLNQIFLGQNAHGVAAAAQIYYRKDVRQLTVPEAAILAGLPQAPSRYSPIRNPASAKDRQRYVLRRMAEVGFISNDEADKFINEPVTLYTKEKFEELAPYYLEIVRQSLTAELGDETVQDKGLKIYTGLDLNKQIKAQEHVQAGLRALDKRQGYRGALKNITDTKLVAEFLLDTRNALMDESSPERILKPDGTFEPRGPLNLTGKDAEGKTLPVVPVYIPPGKITQGVVTKVDDTTGLVFVRFAESQGLIDLESMDWARKPDTNVKSEEAKIKKPSAALKTGDIIQIKVAAAEFSSERLTKLQEEMKKKLKGRAGATLELPNFKLFAKLELEQEPVVEGALLAIDEKTGDVISMVGGYDFTQNKFNRALQARRQTGSSFKALVYLAALDKGYTPATPIIDAPIVFDEQPEEGQDTGKNGEIETKVWRPKNDSNKFGGDILFRNALIRSLNIPTVKIIEKIGVDWSATYSRRLGIFSPLNMDFTLALGTSGVTLYEMTRAFGVIGRLGKKLSPVLVRKVVAMDGQEIVKDLTLDQRFRTEKTDLTRIEADFEDRRQKCLKDPDCLKREPPIFFQDPDQMIRPETAYVATTILQGVVDESGGTGGSARSLGRPVAGKTGTTNGYYDAWFVGFTPDVVTGVWVGFDEEKSIGRGEVGAKAALPIWLDYMKVAHEGLSPKGFPVPDGVVFANIDNQTGRLVSSSSKLVVRQAFIDGTEPGSEANPETPENDSNFYKEDLAD